MSRKICVVNVSTFLYLILWWMLFCSFWTNVAWFMIYEKMTIFDAVSEKKYEIDTVMRQQFVVTVKS